MQCHWPCMEFQASMVLPARGGSIEIDWNAALNVLTIWKACTNIILELCDPIWSWEQPKQINGMQWKAEVMLKRFNASNSNDVNYAFNLIIIWGLTFVRTADFGCTALRLTFRANCVCCTGYRNPGCQHRCHNEPRRYTYSSSSYFTNHVLKIILYGTAHHGP